MNLDGGFPIFTTNHAATSDQLQRDAAVELCRPTDGHFQPSSRQQALWGSKQHAITAHVDGLAEADLIFTLAAENFETNFSFDREAVSTATIRFFFFQFRNHSRHR